MDAQERVVVEVRCVAAEAELAADELLTAGASAVAEAEADHDHVVLTADPPVSAVEELVARGRRVQVVEPAAGWRDAWRAHARTWTAGPFLVRPPWLPADLRGAPAGAIDLVVDPGHAFGSASHASTRLCLDALARLVTPGATVIDVGCGSGILAVGALLLGAAHALGVDPDPAASAAAPAVAAANGVAERFTVSDRPLDELVAEPADLVVANLLVPLIEELGADLLDATRPGGALVVSGLLVDQRDRALDALRPMRVVDALTEDGWLALVLR